MHKTGRKGPEMSESWIYQHQDDAMEFGETGFQPTSDGWMINKNTGYARDPEGKVYDANGEVVFDPTEEDEYDQEEDDYEWYQ